MNNKIWLLTLVIFVFLSDSTYAQNIFGGDTINYSISKCKWFTINITSAVWNEWRAYPNCTEQTAGNFYCACKDNWNVSLTPKQNSVGTFNLTIKYFMGSYRLLYFIDVGDMGDNMAYLLGWSKPQPKTSGGSWGGVKDPRYWRTTSCTYCRNGDSADVLVPFINQAREIIVEHLDGVPDDSFDIYVYSLSKLSWIKVGHYSDQTSKETIKITEFDINPSVGFILSIRITATGKHWSEYNKYGQLAIHKIEVYG